jgi:trans-2,3-dihydro-3-hydroxyanthranilate isomerase
MLPFHTLDVFTDQRFAGNPLAVVLEADGLDTARMQAIAREFNLSETVFVLRPDNPAHTAKVRIFTPGQELPFAGHPTVGTAALLAELRAPGLGTSREAIVVLEEAIGVVRVGVRMAANQAPFAEFDAPKLPTETGPAPSNELLAAAIGLLPSEIGFENHRPSCFSAGVPFTFVPIASLAAIAKARVDSAGWETAFGREGGTGAFLYTRETIHTSSGLHARMFWPHSGIGEDPATGSAAVALGGALLRYDTPPDGFYRRVVEQGFEMGRPSLITVSLDIASHKLKAIRIGGHAVRVNEGRIAV